MSKVAVIYEGKYGTTEKYAGWIAEATGADVFQASKCKAADVEAYDTIVFGGAIHAGKILGIQFLQKNIDKLSGKRILAFAVGLNVDGAEIREQCIGFNFIKKLAGIPCYFFPGAYDPAKISGMDKVIMGTMKKFMKNMMSGEQPEDQKGTEMNLLDAIEHGADFTDRDRITPLVNAVREG